MNKDKYNPLLLEATDEELNALTKDDLKELIQAYPINHTSHPYLRYKYSYKGKDKPALGTYSTVFNLMEIGYTISEISSKLKVTTNERAPIDLGTVKNTPPVELKAIEVENDFVFPDDLDSVEIEEKTIPLEELSKEDLQLMCTNRGIEFKKTHGVKTLLELLK